MSYKVSAKNRKFKGRIIKFLRALKFKWNNSSLYFKMIFIWNIILIISLFTNWSYTINFELQNTAFSILSWFAWYLILIISILSLFIIISNNKKETIKLSLPIKINELSFLFFASISQLLLVTTVFFFIRWLLTFSENIVYWKWIIFAFLGVFINLIGNFIMLKEKNKDNENILVSNDTTWDDDLLKAHIIDKNNMKLPF